MLINRIEKIPDVEEFKNFKTKKFNLYYNANASLLNFKNQKLLSETEYLKSTNNNQQYSIYNNHLDCTLYIVQCMKEKKKKKKEIRKRAKLSVQEKID